MKLIYIAGPYSGPTRCDIMANIQRAREVADRVNRAGAFAVWPHPLGDGIEDSGNEDFWYRGTLEVMRRCDAVVMVEGWESSKGARAEKEEAERLGIPVLAFAEAVRLLRPDAQIPIVSSCTRCGSGEPPWTFPRYQMRDDGAA